MFVVLFKAVKSCFFKHNQEKQSLLSWNIPKYLKVIYSYNILFRADSELQCTLLDTKPGQQSHGSGQQKSQHLHICINCGFYLVIISVDIQKIIKGM